MMFSNNTKHHASAFCCSLIKKKCKFFYIADGFKLDVLLDIRQKSHSADYQDIRGPREVGEEKIDDIEINLVIDGSVVVDVYSWTLYRALSSWVLFLMVVSW
jgi:hypothetical protein